MCSDPRLLYTSNAVHARVSVPALLMMIHESVIYAFTVFGGGKFSQQESRPVLPATPLEDRDSYTPRQPPLQFLQKRVLRLASLSLSSTTNMFFELARQCH